MDTARRSGRSTRRRRSGSPTFGQLLTAAVESAADAVAVRSGDEEFTYRQLDADSSRLARELIERGVGPGDVVAIGIARGIESVLAVWAIAKTGAAYVPVDPAYPAERIAHIVSDSGATIGLTTSQHRRKLGSAIYWIELNDPVVARRVLDRPEHPISYADRVRPLDERHPAYVIYTSGSTGRPKGVVVPHRNVLRLFDNTQRHFDFGAADVWTMFHSYAFDFSVWELWGALLFGGKLIVVDYFTARSPQQFRELLVREQVTVLNQTPSAFYQLIAADAAEARADYALRTVVFGGEALEPQRLAPWFERYPDQPRLVNMYGITETTVHVSYRAIQP
ncbi:AMP-binding protein, partial [Streptomyces roseolus]|uniref:AMP-binding protein n=1 Tax=Streptomyces roseolus TaxID=67358 RepID=UPI003665492A